MSRCSNGVSATISLEDGGHNYRQEGVWNTSQLLFAPGGAGNVGAPTYGTAPNTFTGNYQTGVHVPDIVGNIRFEQAWGSLHFAGALHNVSASYYGAQTTAGAAGPALDINGHPSDTWGGAVTGALELKNLPTGANDSIKIDATWAHGAPKYVFGSTLDTLGGGRFLHGDGGTVGFGYVFDGVFTGATAATGTGISLSTSYGVRAFFNHYWTPQWNTSLWGAWAHNEFSAGANAVMLAAMNQGGNGQGTGSAFGTLAAGGALKATGTLNLNLYQVGTTTSWQPVKDLTFSAEFIYSRIDQNLVGTYLLPTAGISGSSGLKTITDQNMYNGAVRVLRSF